MHKAVIEFIQSIEGCCTVVACFNFIHNLLGEDGAVEVQLKMR